MQKKKKKHVWTDLKLLRIVFKGANYEAIQSDIFDHILAIVPEFDLKLFQSPAGSDLKEFADTRNQ